MRIALIRKLRLKREYDCVKKKTTIIALIVVFVLLLVLFLPTQKMVYDDGGTCVYAALTYKIVKWNKVFIVVGEGSKKYQKTSVFWFPDNQKTLGELWEMEWANK